MAVPRPTQAKTPILEAAVKIEPTPKGARVTRTLKQAIGGASLSEYDDARNVFRVFQDARHLVLSFVKK